MPLDNPGPHHSPSRISALREGSLPIGVATAPRCAALRRPNLCHLRAPISVTAITGASAVAGSMQVTRRDAARGCE